MEDFPEKVGPKPEEPRKPQWRCEQCGIIDEYIEVVEETGTYWVKHKKDGTEETGSFFPTTAQTIGYLCPNCHKRVQRIEEDN